MPSVPPHIGSFNVPRDISAGHAPRVCLHKAWFVCTERYACVAAVQTSGTRPKPQKIETADRTQGSVTTGSGGRGQPHASASCCGRGRPRRQTISAARRHGRRTLGMLYVRGRPGMMGSVVSMMFIRWRGSMGCMMTTCGQAPHTESQRQQHGTENAVHKNSFARSGEIQRNGGGKKAPVTKGRLLFPSVFFLRPDMLFARERPAACLLPGTPFTVTLSATQLRSNGCDAGKFASRFMFPAGRKSPCVSCSVPSRSFATGF